MRIPEDVQEDHDDRLDRMDRPALLRALAAYYRDVGWWVERFDGEAADLRLRRDAEVVLLRCDGWRDGPATPMTVRALGEAVANETATGGVLIGREFDASTVEAIGRSRRMKGIDREGLHALLGVLPETPSQDDPFAERPREADTGGADVSTPTSIARDAEDGRRRAGRRRAWRWALALAVAVGCVLIVLAFARASAQPPFAMHLR